MIKDSIKIGSMTLKNRLVMSPMATYKTMDGGVVNDALCNYYEERAKDGLIGVGRPILADVEWAKREFERA